MGGGGREREDGAVETAGRERPGHLLFARHWERKKGQSRGLCNHFPIFTTKLNTEPPLPSTGTLTKHLYLILEEAVGQRESV